MNANEVIDAYVRDVAVCLPRSKRADVACELRALLADELSAQVEAEGRAPDRAMAMALLQRFGRPAEAARRYHERPALVDPACTHHFLIWALGGTIVLGMHAALGNEIDLGAMFLQWLGVLLICFSIAGWWRRRRPDTFGWKPTRGPDWMPRRYALLALVAFVVFPVAMYVAPMGFARMLLPDSVPVGGMALAAEFADSLLRMATLVLLVLTTLQYAVALVIGREPRWLRRTGVVTYLLLGLLLIAHASSSVQVFVSANANATASSWFLATGGMLLLVGMYCAYRDWVEVPPVPVLETV